MSIEDYKDCIVINATFSIYDDHRNQQRFAIVVNIVNSRRNIIIWNSIDKEREIIKKIEPTFMIRITHSVQKIKMQVSM